MKNPIPITVLFLLGLLACEKSIPADPIDSNNYTLILHNEYNLLEAQLAAFVCDAEGTPIGFRWLNAKDSTHLELPNTSTSDRFDCNLVKMTISNAFGFPDTTLEVRSFEQIRSGTEIYLRENFFQQLSNLNLKISGLNSLDSIVVSDGLPFDIPAASNNYEGVYRVLHSGKILVRLLVDGESDWRYTVVDNVQSDTVSLDLQASTMPVLSSTPKRMNFPFLDDWDYNVDAVINLSTPELLPLGGLLRQPGGLQPNLSFVDLWDIPGNIPSQYRIRALGTAPGPNGAVYEREALYSDIPQQLEEPLFEIQLAGPVQNDQVEVSSSGVYATIHFIRNFDRQGMHIEWEFVQQAETGNIQNRLPQLPTELSTLFPELGQYQFGNLVRVKGTFFDQNNVYDAALAPQFLNQDPLWRAKAGLLSWEQVFF